MASPSDSVQAKLKELRNAFSTQLPGKVRQIEEAWAALPREGWDPDQVETVARLLHTLAGTAGTFGFSAVRAAARSMEAALRAGMNKGAPTGGALPGVGEHLAALRGACGETAAAPVVPVPQPEGRASSSAGSDSDEVFVVDDEPLVTESLSVQLRCYGYRPSMFSTIAGLREALKSSTPRVIIMDLAFPEGRLAGAQAIMDIHHERTKPIPVIFLSGRSDFNSRLEAVRAGGNAFFVKPVDIGRIVDMLDVLTARKPRAPYRVLIVDDEPLLADYHSTVLKQAGMATAVVTEPSRAMEVLVDFRPELILMDVYMPGCSGMELANVIRQDETYIDIPIVYLSSETDIDRQLEALGRGGDDFLIKPIQADHLITSVTLRADRYRMLRSFMLYDGLTGLLNHTKTKEQLDIEVSRASRQNTGLSFAMIDIDHFKSVNDTHGHPVGDQVIKSLSRLLKQRLRTTDTVGRFGGEEFAVILTDTDGATALRILNELREDFSKIRHTSREGPFSSTFSCGISCPAKETTGAALIADADTALYAAKRNGRNRVVFCDAAAAPQ